MVSNRQRRKALARAKWQRQQARRTAAQRRARIFSIVGGTAAAVVLVIFLGWGVVQLIHNNNSPGQTTPTFTDQFPSFLTPSNPGITVTGTAPATPTTGGGATTGGTHSTAPTAPVTTSTTGGG
ncbi:MAG: hypothetical protein QOI51_234 [Nocardioidaceae bacterium]|nr:hypothetical protein [Nocardioidaceae bacterium]